MAPNQRRLGRTEVPVGPGEKRSATAQLVAITSPLSSPVYSSGASR